MDFNVSAIDIPTALKTTIEAFSSRFGLTLHGKVFAGSQLLWSSSDPSTTVVPSQDAVKRLYTVGIAFRDDVRPLTFKTTDESFIKSLSSAWTDSTKRLYIGYEDLDGTENFLLLDLRDIVAVHIT